MIGSVCALAALGISSDARPDQVAFVGEFAPMAPSLAHVPFQMLDVPAGKAVAPASRARPAHLAGSSIAALADGALVIDGDSGRLVRLDAAGAVAGRLDIGAGASQLVVDRANRRAFVADRAGDRIAVVDLADGVAHARDISTHTEPFGVALTPDATTLLVTTVADRQLTAYDAATGAETWSLPLGPEPRGVAIAPDGDTALVTFLTTGTVARVHLGASPRVSYETLDPAERAPTANQLGGLGAIAPAAATHDAGRQFARNAFAPAFIGHDLAIVAHQISTPHQATAGRGEVVSSYGGGGAFQPPIAHRLSFLGGKTLARAHISVHQPRAVAYDPARDMLWVAGYGSDQVLAIADVSQASVAAKWLVPVPGGDDGCGPNGLAIADDGAVLAFCSLSRRVATIAAPATATEPVVATSDPVYASRLTAAERRGRSLFRRGADPRLSSLGAMACTSCHPEGRTDGLSWRIESKALQTPLLAGRIVDGVHPFKWDGGDATLNISLTSTVKRLGGSGITAAQAADVEAFLATIPAPRAPRTVDEAAVARGKRLFQSEATGCATCHSGPAYTNGKAYELAHDIDKVDTPSLIGLAASAPYYHDGSAGTLRALLLDNGTVHGMGNTKSLTPRQIDDLIAFLLTL